MNIKAMNLFLSEENIKRHLEYLRNIRLKLSILEKSIPELKGKNMGEINRLNLSREVREEALQLIWKIKSHECFFNSFSETVGKSELLKNTYSSVEKFLYELFLEAMKQEDGFLYVYADRGVVKRKFMREFEKSFLKIDPMLALDLYEHTYLLDYGFAKDKFIRSALMYFDLSRLN